MWRVHTTHFYQYLGQFMINIVQSRNIIKKTAYNDCPWLTKGLKNACKKKNALYRNFIRKRTKEAEDKYKKYKNKLTSIQFI